MTKRDIVYGGMTGIFAGQPLGWTEDPVSIAYNYELLIIDKVQQRPGIVDEKRISGYFQIKMNLLSGTLETLKLILGINATIVTSGNKRRLNIDQSGDLIEGPLILYGKGPGGIGRTWYFNIAKIKETGELSYDARGYTKVAITIDSIEDESGPVKGYIEEEYLPGLA